MKFRQKFSVRTGEGDDGLKGFPRANSGFEGGFGGFMRPQADTHLSHLRPGQLSHGSGDGRGRTRSGAFV